jgi:hypothetical protein
MTRLGIKIGGLRGGSDRGAAYGGHTLSSLPPVVLEPERAEDPNPLKLKDLARESDMRWSLNASDATFSLACTTSRGLPPGVKASVGALAP